MGIDEVDLIIELRGVAHEFFRRQFFFQILYRNCRTDIAEIIHEYKYTSQIAIGGLFNEFVHLFLYLVSPTVIGHTFIKGLRCNGFAVCNGNVVAFLFKYLIY